VVDVMAEKLDVETSRLDAGKRTLQWRDTLAALCGPLHLDGYGESGIEGRIEAVSIGQLKLSRIMASQHRAALPPAWAGPGHHDVIKVVLQLDGTSILEQGGRRIAISPGEGIAYDVSRPHRMSNPASTKHLVAVIPKELAAPQGMALDGFLGRPFSRSDWSARLTCDLVETALNNDDTFQQEQGVELAELILRSLRLSLATSETRDPLSWQQQIVRKAKSYIHEHLRDPDLDLGRIANSLNCSKRYLHMAFSSQSLTVARYIWHARLDLSRHELQCAEEGRTITDVAMACGFASASHFSRTYRLRFGTPPSKAR
jgi:AraC family transcriptional regulator, positive regulator of tynA and feaB